MSADSRAIVRYEYGSLDVLQFKTVPLSHARSCGSAGSPDLVANYAAPMNSQPAHLGNTGPLSWGLIESGFIPYSASEGE